MVRSLRLHGNKDKQCEGSSMSGNITGILCRNVECESRDSKIIRAGSGRNRYVSSRDERVITLVLTLSVGLRLLYDTFMLMCIRSLSSYLMFVCRMLFGDFIVCAELVYFA